MDWMLVKMILFNIVFVIVVTRLEKRRVMKKVKLAIMCGPLNQLQKRLDEI